MSETNGYQHRRRSDTSKLSDGPVRALERRTKRPRKAFGKRATGTRSAPWVCQHTVPRLESRGVARGPLWRGPGLGGEDRGAARIAHLSETRGSERQLCSLRSLKCVSPWAGSRSGSFGSRSGGVGPGVSGSAGAAPTARRPRWPGRCFGEMTGGGLSLLLPAPAGTRVNPPHPGLSALKAAAPGSERLRDLRARGGSASGHPSSAPAAAAVCSRRVLKLLHNCTHLTC